MWLGVNGPIFTKPKNEYALFVQGFFDGIEKLRASGTKAEEVGFRLEYSKTELKKCIKEYPGKEVSGQAK